MLDYPRAHRYHRGQARQRRNAAHRSEGAWLTTDDGQRNHLFIVNDSPYGSERPYNALRLAKRPNARRCCNFSVS